MSDPVEAAIEEALCPGRYVSEHASFSLVSELESVAARIAGAAPERAARLYETFIAACYEKADEVDDSSGFFGTFGGSLFSRWVTARQAASADPADTVARLLAWMAKDQYGFWSHVEDDIASALDEAGRAACAGHLECLLDTGTEPAFTRRQLDKLLRAVYIAQRDENAYIALAERSGLTAKDCLAMATILAGKDDPAAALTWTERGLAIDTSYDLRAKQRELLIALGRRDEAIRREWSHFIQVPAIYSYQALMELVPETERATWHDKAIEAAIQSDASLSVLLPLLVDTKEVAHLARAHSRCGKASSTRSLATPGTRPSSSRPPWRPDQPHQPRTADHSPGGTGVVPDARRATAAGAAGGFPPDTQTARRHPRPALPRGYDGDAR